MKLFRHILSHLFMIFFLIAVVSIFYYRTLLFPTDVVENIDGVVKEVYSPALKFVSTRDYFWSIGGERIVSFDDLTIFEKNDELATKSESEDVIKVESTVKAETNYLETIEKEVEPEQIDIAKTDESVAAIEPIKGNSKIEDLPVVVKDSDTSSERELLISARKAFNKGTVIESEKFYLELIQLDNDNPDIFGELGNVYYSQGKWDEAGQAYYEAAVRLLTARNYSQVAYLQRVIKGLNTEHAEKLAQLMMRR